HLARLAMDAHRLDAGARPRRRAAVGLERGGGSRLRRRARVPRDEGGGAADGVPDRRDRLGAWRLALRRRTGAGLRRAARRRAVFVTAACALYVAAGVVALAWLRELGLDRGPALAGGLAFAIAPYRVDQSVGHLLGPISLLLPLALWAFERARRGSLAWGVLAAAALASIPLSGQVHLALGAIPFFALYALCRTRDWRLLAGPGACVLAAIAAG